MTDRFYEAVYSEKLSKERGDIRYIIIDQDTGEILDDANGWGYKSARNAYRRFGYTQSETHQAYEQSILEIKLERARNYYRANRDLYQALINARSFLPDLHTRLNDDGTETLTIHNMDNKGTKEPFTVEVVERLLAMYNTVEDLPFSAQDIYEAYMKYE